MTEPAPSLNDIDTPSRSIAIRLATFSAGGFVGLLLLTAPLRDEPPVVMASYVVFLLLFLLTHYWHRRRPALAGALCSLGPFVLVTVMANVRGGVVSPPGMTAYVTLVLFASVCWSGRGAFVIATLSSLVIAWFASTGPQVPGMGGLQVWAEMTFQLFSVALIAAAALGVQRRVAAQAILLEGERGRAREAREALEARVARSQALEAVGRLAGGVAHDFNNLLTVILSAVELLRRSKQLSPMLAEDVDRIEEAADRAAKLTGQLLAVGRKQMLSPVVLCPREVVLGLHPLLTRLLPASAELVVSAQPDTGNVTVDETRLEQVLINLVTNASDSLSGGGTITISTGNVTIAAEPGFSPRSRHPSSPGVGTPGLVPPGDYVEIDVRDTGSGMSEEVRARIFEPFFTTKGGTHGTGLGLATVLGIVTQSGGFVDVDSEPGQGSTFRAYFPRTSASVTRIKALSDRPSAAHALRILLVEDEADVRAATVRILESLGHVVIAAENGQTALSLIAERKESFDVLITDVVMPGMGGPALAEQLRRENPSLRVLFISGYAADDLPHQDEMPLGEEYLSKPFTRAALAAKLAQVLFARR